MRYGIPFVAAVLSLTACGEEAGSSGASTATKAAEQWAAALDRNDLKTACALTLVERDCEARMAKLAEADLSLDGEATIGTTPAPGEEVLSFSGKETVFVTAVPSDQGFRLRIELSVLPPP